MVQTKLTLRLDEELIRRAKAFARQRGKSVSRVVADYFSALGKNRSKPGSEFTPIVRTLKGSLRGTGVDVKDHRRHLEEKYL
jgi:hypothetical protein